MEEEYYTVKEVASRFKVTKAAVYQWMRDGKLRFVIVGSERRVTGDALREFVKPGVIDRKTSSDEEIFFPCLVAA